MATEGFNSARRAVLKGLALGAFAYSASDLLADDASLPSLARNPILPRSAPEAQGIDPSAILDFIEAAEKGVDALHSFVLVRHGRVVSEGGWEPYSPKLRHMLFSLSKSFNSTAVGLAVHEKKFAIDDPVISFFPEDAPSQPSENLSAMRVRHLLTMTSGHDQDTLGALFERPDNNWIKAFLALPVQRKPGTHFVYNTGASFMLSAIVQKTVGMTVRDFLEPRLFAPLGIKKAVWEKNPQGINCGGYGLSLSAEEIARFGQLYLRKGVWNGERLLPLDWIESATTKQVNNGSDPNSDWAQGYGFQFWRCRHGAFRGDGAFGQYCIVLPEKDAVIAITSGLGDMQAALNCVWDHLLPGMKDAPLSSGSGGSALKRKIESLSLQTPKGAATSPAAAKASGKTFAFEKNDQKIESIAFEFKGDRAILRVKNEFGVSEIECGSGAWIRGAAKFFDPTAQKIASSGAWTSDDSYSAKVCMIETPFINTFACQFAEDRVTLTVKGNVGFGPTDQPALVGKAA